MPACFPTRFFFDLGQNFGKSFFKIGQNMIGIHRNAMTGMKRRGGSANKNGFRKTRLKNGLCREQFLPCGELTRLFFHEKPPRKWPRIAFHKGVVP